MPTSRLPLRVRAGVAVVIVALVAAIGAGTAAVQVGAAALRTGGGFTASSSWSPSDRWVGIELENRSGTPITLHAVVPRSSSNLEVLEARVIRPEGSHLLMLSEPLTSGLRSALDGSRPVGGFVLPPHSREQYEIALRVRPHVTGQAVLARTAVVYSVWGLDHGVVSDGVYCIRAPGRQGCPPS